MADVKLYAPICLGWESSKYTENPHDPPTKYGVTVGSWQTMGYDKNFDGHIDKEDVKLLTYDDFVFILNHFWNYWKANDIQNQSIANLLVDWVYNSGAWGIKIPQSILKVNPDGVVGKMTIDALNNYANKSDLFHQIVAARLNFLDGLVKRNPNNSIYINGWKRRVLSFQFKL